MDEPDCPRCGALLELYSTDDGENAYVCADCGYADVPVEHRSEADETESWDEAFDRFVEENE